MFARTIQLAVSTVKRSFYLKSWGRNGAFSACDIEVNILDLEGCPTPEVQIIVFGARAATPIRLRLLPNDALDLAEALAEIAGNANRRRS